MVFLRLIYPPRCQVCGCLTEGAFCRTCERLLPRITGPVCRYCGKPVQRPMDDCTDCRGRRLYYDAARAAWAYDGAARAVIRAFKYANLKSLAPELSRYLPAPPPGGDLITWVPLAGPKARRRGYNQAKLLARGLSESSGLPATGLLLRVKATAEQNKLDPIGRRRNVRNAFKPVPGKAVAGKTVILVDDVYTTGATVAECARVLKESGARSVNVVTLARTLVDQ